MKKIIAICLAICLLLSMAACGGEAVPEHTLADVEGVWEISGSGEFLIFYSDLSWEAVSNQGDMLDSGEFSFDGQELIAAIGGEMVSFGWSETGDLYSEEDVVLLTRLCGLEGEDYQAFLDMLLSNQAHFDRMGYEINYNFGDGQVYMENGVFVMANGGQHFARMPNTVSMEIDSFNDTGDGFVEIEFTHRAWLASENFPEFIYDVDYYENGMVSGLYDYYTGYNLPASTTYGDTERGDNYFYFEFESQGRTICVDYNYSTEWIKDSTGSKEFVKHIFIRMPADYDGIVYGVPEGYPDFVTYALNNSGEEKTIGPMDDTNKENAIFCRVNTI